MIVKTPEPPYYAVIFTSIKKNEKGYQEMAVKMEELAKKQPGYLGFESVREKMGISVSYWKDLERIKLWKQNAEHQLAQELGRIEWYSAYKIMIARVERDYHF